MRTTWFLEPGDELISVECYLIIIDDHYHDLLCLWFPRRRQLHLQFGPQVTTLNRIFYHAKGATPLMIALMTGQHDCAAALIACGAQVHLKNSRGWTAADFAEGRSVPEFLQQALQGRVEACQRVSLLAQGWVEMRF